MSATLSGLIVLENARLDDGGLPLSVLLDGQMWLGPGRVLTGTFRYYNSPNYSFPEVGNYFVWIHVAKFTPELPVPLVVVHAQVPVTNGGVAAEPQPGTERQPSKEEQQKDEEVATGSSGASDGPTASSDALEEPATGSDMLHVVGDIVQLIPTKTDDTCQQAYINVSGAAVNPNKTGSFFEINAAQYTSHYKSSPLSVLPVRAHFNSNKYRNRKPMPSNNTYVSVGGFLTNVDTDAAGHATLFHMSIDNISFLGRAGTHSPSIIGGLGPSTPSRSSRFKYDFGASSPSSSPFSQVSTPNTPSTSATLGSPEPESPTRQRDAW